MKIEEVLILPSIVLLIIALALYYRASYTRIFIKRSTMRKKIKKLCKKKGYKLHPARTLWWLGRNGGTRPDFYIVTKEYIVSVKLFASKTRHGILIFEQNGSFYLRKYIGIRMLGNSFITPYKSMPGKLHKIFFNYGFKDEWYTKTPIKIMLLNPTPMEVRLTGENGKENVVSSSQQLFGAYIYSLTGFLSRLEAIDEI